MARVLKVGIKFFSFKGMSWREIPPMIVLALCALWVLEWTRQYARDNAPVEEYFDVRQIAVPGHPVGVDPSIVYDRKINKDFDAQWTVQVQDVNQNLKDICIGGKSQHYFKDKALPREGVTLTWLLQPALPCVLTPSSYRVVVCWEIERELARNAKKCYTTQPFNVFDPKQIMEQAQ